MLDAASPHDHMSEDDLDGCICDIEMGEAEAVADSELPAATGGVELLPLAAAEDEEGDHDDIDPDEDVTTSDADLPPATGGVA